MKRAFPQKVKPVATQVAGDAETTGQLKQAPHEVNRRACTSAAVIGLAISMGASSLLMPQQNDGAVASEPVVAEPSLIDASSSLPAPTTESAVTKFPAPELIVVEHMVQEGQTLYHLAKVYKIDLAAIAALNGIAPDSVLQIGQIVKVPAVSAIEDDRAYQSVASNEPFYSAYNQPSNSVTPSEQVVPSSLKMKVSSVVVKPQIVASVPAPESASLPKDQFPSTLVSPDLVAPSIVDSTTPIVALAPKALSSTSSNVNPEDLEVVNPDAMKPPEKGQVSSQQGKPVAYRVKQGDTLAAIARSHGLSVDELAKINRLTDPNYLLVNQTIKVPSSSNILASADQPSQLTQTSQFQSVEVATTSTNLQVIPAEVPATNASGTGTSAETAQEKAEAVAVAPLSGGTFAPPSNDASTQLGNDSYYSSYAAALRMEIVQLRQKYRQAGEFASTATEGQPTAFSSTSTVQPPVAQVETQVPNTVQLRPGNAEFGPRQQVQEIQTSVIAQSQPSTVNSELPFPNSAAPLYATAPAGYDSYAPIVESLVGQTVSPDLPPLGSADRYLPDATQQAEGFIWPTKGILTSGYGWRWGRMHRGIDIAGPVGTPIVAAASGTVVTAGWNSGGYGNLVEIRHADGSLTLYAHNSRILVRPGQQVEQGELVAEMGSTGYSTGPHLHFEVHPAGKGAINPIALLPRR